MAHEALLETLLKGYEEGALREFFANLTNYISADGKESWGTLRDPDRGEMPILMRSVADSERHRLAFNSRSLGSSLRRTTPRRGLCFSTTRRVTTASAI
jgi:hypothetical protein